MRIACALVTFNRLELLKGALAAASGQSRTPERIFIINNASTDATRDYLDALSDPRVTPIHTSTNLGGAGGFRLAVDLAAANGFDAVWLFDDDGMPDTRALEVLEAALDNSDLALANSLVVSHTDSAQLAFGLIKETPGYRGASIFTVADAEAAARDGLLLDMANPFNGTLVRCSAARAIGPMRNEMFLWGDEVEFMRRLIRRGHRVATVIAARHRHPQPKTTVVETRFGPTRVPSKGREVYFYRNRTFNACRHLGLSYGLKDMIKTALRNVARGALIEGGMTIVWGLDGMFDLYVMKPSRSTLDAAWQAEFQSALVHCKTSVES
ncbi:rhamnopyranosyl-N-acetylglucosaminyl-diphospho-decaprenol beta-1,3/1,4-galactofuranosyltransferase [Bradyrhizobium sp. USDA 4472]